MYPMINNKKTIILFFSIFFLILPIFIHASFDYTVMETIPGVVTAGETSPGFNVYIQKLYGFALWAIGICALLMISIGAFMYLTSAGNNAAMSSAKKIITDAIVGLILAFVAYLILYTINPDLVNPIGIASSGSTTESTVIQAGNLSHQEAVDMLSASGISVVSTTGCLGEDSVGCTTLDNIPTEAINNIIELKNLSGINFQITGGTETSGHKTHGPGKPIMDIQVTDNNNISSMNSFLEKNRSSLNIKTIYSSSGYTDANVSESYGVYHIEFKSE